MIAPRDREAVAANLSVRGVSVSDVVFVVLTVALFAALALVVRAVEKL
ncbi:hypothetical protein [Micromonospora avicenniae]